MIDCQRNTAVGEELDEVVDILQRGAAGRDDDRFLGGGDLLDQDPVVEIGTCQLEDVDAEFDAQIHRRLGNDSQPALKPPAVIIGEFENEQIFKNAVWLVHWTEFIMLDASSSRSRKGNMSSSGGETMLPSSSLCELMRGSKPWVSSRMTSHRYGPG